MELQIGWERSVGPRCAWGMAVGFGVGVFSFGFLFVVGSGFFPFLFGVNESMGFGIFVFSLFGGLGWLWWWFSLCLFGGGLGVCRSVPFSFSPYHDLKPNTYAALK